MSNRQEAVAEEAGLAAPGDEGLVVGSDGDRVLVRKDGGDLVAVPQPAGVARLIVVSRHGERVSVRGRPGDLALFSTFKLPLKMTVEVEDGCVRGTYLADDADDAVPYVLDLDDRDVDDESEEPTLDLSAEWRGHDGSHAQNLGD